MNIPVIRLVKSKKCHECDERKKEGTKFSCEKCNESHFVCLNCIPTYLKYEDESSCSKKNEYSEPIYTEDGVLVGSDPSHFQKSEVIIPNNPNIENAVDNNFSRYHFSKKVQKDYQ